MDDARDTPPVSAPPDGVSHADGWGALRRRVAECLSRVDAKLGEPALACLRDRNHWQALAADLDLGHRLLGYLDDGGVAEERIGQRVLIGQCALFLATAAKNTARADWAVAEAAKWRRRWRLAAIGGGIVVALAALGYGVWALLQPSPGFLDRALAELANHPVDALLFGGVGVGVVHLAERHRGLPGSWNRLVASLPVALVCVVALAALGLDAVHDLGYGVPFPSLWFDLKCLGLGLGATYLVRLHRLFRART